MDAPRNILIVLTGALGDIARGLAVIDGIRAKYPECAIDWLAESRWAPLVELHPEVRTVHRWTRKAWFRSTLEVRKTLKDQYDVVLDLQRILKSGVLSFLTGAPRRIGFHRRNAKELNWLFSTEQLPFRENTIPKIEQYLDAAALLGAERSGRVSFGLDRAHLPRLPVLPERYVAVILGSAWPSKDWTAAGYAALLRSLRESGEEVVLLGGAESIRLAAQLQSLQPVVSLVGQTSLVELVAVLKHAQCAVGPDSGPGHVSAAVGTPYVSLFGPTSPERTAPYGNAHLVVRSEPLSCQPCYKRRCPGFGHICMHLVSPQTVVGRIASVLEGSAKPIEATAETVVG